MSMIIYKTTNLINGKIYIGKDEQNRLNYLGSGVNIGRAIKKYGKENFAKVTIDAADNRKDLCLKEIGWIKHFRELGLELYNIAPGGEGGSKRGENNPNFGKRGELSPNFGLRRSDETKQKMSVAHAGKSFSEEHKKKISLALLGKPFSEEHKQKIGSTMSDGRMKGENNPRYGMRHSEESLQKMRATMSDGRRKGEKSSHYGKKKPELSKKMTGQNNPMSRTNREKRRLIACRENIL